MKIQIREERPEALSAYSQIPIAFLVESRFRVELVEGGLGGFTLIEEKLPTPYTKDYDADPNEGPSNWAKQWDLSRWGIFSAFADGERLGGVVIAFDMQGIDFVSNRQAEAVVWDIRIKPAVRGQGVGGQLMERAMAWAGARGCAVLKAETQNVNVPACRFYACQGYALEAIRRHAYVSYPEEVQLIWQRELR